MKTLKSLGILLLAILLVCCKPETSNVIPGLARAYLDRVGQQQATVQSNVEEVVKTGNLHDWTEKIIDHLAFISFPDSGGISVLKFKTLPDFGTKRSSWIADFKQRELIKVDDRIIKLSWTLSTGETFKTYGVEQPDGRIRFEPVLHFAVGRVVNNGVRAVPGSLVIKDKELYVENGWGVKVAHGKWDIMVDISNCKVVGPPMKVINTLCSEAFLWSAACNDGSAIYVRPKSTCPGGTEECLQWVIELGYTRLDNVSVDMTVAGNYGGVSLRGTLRKNDIGWGDIKRDHGILCARSGDLIETPNFELQIGNAVQDNHAKCLEQFITCQDRGVPCTSDDPRWGETNCGYCFKRCRAGKSLPDICGDCGF